MPVSGLAQVTESAGRTWKPVAEDVYQVVIKDITEKTVKKYQSDEDTVQYLFKFVVLDEGEFNQQMLTSFCSTSWFKGGVKGMNASKLVTIFRAVYGFYMPGIDVNSLKAAEVNSLMMQNVLIGTQLRVNVKLTDDKLGNKITDFMMIKKELPVPAEVIIEGEFKLKAEQPAQPSAEVPFSADEFLQSLETDEITVEQMTTEEIANKLA